MKLDFIFTYLLPPHLQTPQPPGDPLALVRGRRRGAGPGPPGNLSRSPARFEHPSRSPARALPPLEVGEKSEI